MYNPFTEHPKKVNETYLEHMWKAIKFSIKLYLLSYKAMTHSIFPFLFEYDTSDGVRKLNTEMQKRKKVVKCGYCNRLDGTCGCANRTNVFGDDDWATPTGEEK